MLHSDLYVIYLLSYKFTILSSQGLFIYLFILAQVNFKLV